MNEAFESMKERTKQFARKAKDEAVLTGRKAAAWANRNKEMLIIAAPVAIAALRSGQSLVVNRRVKSERSRIDHTYYDPSTGFHWDLRRKVTNKERAEILKRKENGQDIYTILSQMKLIK